MLDYMQIRERARWFTGTAYITLTGDHPTVLFLVAEAGVLTHLEVVEQGTDVIPCDEGTMFLALLDAASEHGCVLDARTGVAPVWS